MPNMGDVRIPIPEPITLHKNPLINIRYFIHQWKYYCIATGLNEASKEKKLATFFLFVGREAFSFVSDKLELTDEERNDCEKILIALENAHKPKKNVTFERFSFNQAVQEENENVDSFIIKLQNLSEHCEFNERTDEMVRDRFIVGLRNKLVQRELLSEPELSLREAVHLVKLKEVEENGYRSPNYNGNVNEDLNIANSLPKKSADVLKQEPLDDDDIIFINDVPREQEIVDITSEDRPLKKTKFDSRNCKTSTDSRFRENDDSKAESSKDDGNSDFQVGSFVVLKEDWDKLVDPPIWRVDSASLLQKFIPVEHKSIVLYKSTAVYSGWSTAVRDQYYRASVIIRNKQSARKEVIVEFQKDLVPIENKFEKLNGVTCK